MPILASGSGPARGVRGFGSRKRPGEEVSARTSRGNAVDRQPDPFSAGITPALFSAGRDQGENPGLRHRLLERAGGQSTEVSGMRNLNSAHGQDIRTGEARGQRPGQGDDRTRASNRCQSHKAVPEGLRVGAGRRGFKKQIWCLSWCQRNIPFLGPEPGA